MKQYEKVNSILKQLMKLFGLTFIFQFGCEFKNGPYHWYWFSMTVFESTFLLCL